MTTTTHPPTPPHTPTDPCTSHTHRSLCVRVRLGGGGTRHLGAGRPDLRRRAGGSSLDPPFSPCCEFCLLPLRHCLSSSHFYPCMQGIDKEKRLSCQATNPPASHWRRGFVSRARGVSDLLCPACERHNCRTYSARRRLIVRLPTLACQCVGRRTLAIRRVRLIQCCVCARAI